MNEQYPAWVSGAVNLAANLMLRGRDDSCDEFTTEDLIPCSMCVLMCVKGAQASGLDEGAAYPVILEAAWGRHEKHPGIYNEFEQMVEYFKKESKDV